MNKTYDKKVLYLVIAIVIIIIITIIFAFGRNKEEDNTIDNNQVENEVEEKYVQVLDNGDRLNISEKLHEPKKILGLDVTNIQLSNTNGVTVLLATIENNTDKTQELTIVDVDFLDENGNVVETTKAAINKVEPGESVEFNAGITADYVNIYDFRIR